MDTLVYVFSICLQWEKHADPLFGEEIAILARLHVHQIEVLDKVLTVNDFFP